MEQELQPQSGSKPESTYRSPSLIQRIWKYKLHYVIVIPAIFIILLFKIIPLVQGILLSFKDFVIFKGLGGSEWVGLSNYEEVLSNPSFRDVFLNTVSLKLSYLVASAVIAFVVALALSGIRSNRLRGAVTSLLLLPYFIPSILIGSVLIAFLSPSGRFFEGDLFIMTEPSLFPFVLISAELLKTIGIPVIVALAAIASKHASVKQAQESAQLIIPLSASYGTMNVVPALRAVAAVTILQLSAILTTDFDLLHTLLNPMVYESGMTMEMYSFRQGLLQAEYSFAAVVDVIQLLVQLVGLLVAYFIVRGAFLSDLFSSFSHAATSLKTGNASNFLGIAVAIICSAGTLFALYMILIDPFISGNGNAGQPDASVMELGNIVLFLILYGCAVMISLFIIVTLAYPLTVKDLPGRQLYKLFLLAVIASGSGILFDYMYFQKWGLVNTVFPHVYVGIINIVGVFVLKSIFNSKYGHLKEQASSEGRGELYIFFTLFIPKVWKPLLALGMLQFVSLWNSPITSLVYNSDPNQYSPMMRVLQGLMFQSGGSQDTYAFYLQLGVILSLPSVLLFLLCRRWLTSEVLISQFRRR